MKDDFYTVIELIGEIRTLHLEIINQFQVTLPKAIRVGELLTQQKEKLEHGEFAQWINDNLPFTDRTARNYMRVHRERDRLLKTETVSDLKGAYNLLIEHREEGAIEKLERVASIFANVIEFRNKKGFFADDTFAQAACILSEMEQIVTREIEETQDIVKVKALHDLAVKIGHQARDITFHAERELGKCLTRLDEMGSKEKA